MYVYDPFGYIYVCITIWLLYKSVTIDLWDMILKLYEYHVMFTLVGCTHVYVYHILHTAFQKLNNNTEVMKYFNPALILWYIVII